MIFGIQFWMFKVRYAVKASNLTMVQACAQSGPGNSQFVVLENKDSALEQLGANQLKALYSFFTGKELHPFPRYMKDAWPLVRKVFDEDKFQKAAGFKVPALKNEDEPLEVRTVKLQKFADSLPEVKNEGNEPYNPQADKDRASDVADEETQTENEEDTTMAAKKKVAKKSAKKAPAKKVAKKVAAKGAKSEGAGRKAPYEPTAKLTPLVKENPCNPMFAGKPGVRHANMEIILKNPGITFENFIKKGGTLHDLQGLAVRKNYVKISK